MMNQRKWREREREREQVSQRQRANKASHCLAIDSFIDSFIHPLPPPFILLQGKREREREREKDDCVASLSLSLTTRQFSSRWLLIYSWSPPKSAEPRQHAIESTRRRIASRLNGRHFGFLPLLLLLLPLCKCQCLYTRSYRVSATWRDSLKKSKNKNKNKNKTNKQTCKQDKPDAIGDLRGRRRPIAVTRFGSPTQRSKTQCIRKKDDFKAGKWNESNSNQLKFGRNQVKPVNPVKPSKTQ